MIYLLVDKDQTTQEWVVLKTITYPINVRGLSGVIYGDIRVLTLEERKAEGFWTQVDVYEDNGEFKEFSNKDVTFNEETAEMVNTYHYVLMDLGIIKEELKNRVINHRESLLIGGFTKDGKVYGTTYDARVLLQGFVLESMINSELTEVTIRLPDDTDSTLTVQELKELVSELYSYTESLFIKESTIRSNIDNATDYDAVRAAATWDDTPL